MARSTARSKQLRRDIPATRVAAFIDSYITQNYELNESEPTGTTQFSFESGLPERTITRILRGESANCSFELVDDMLIALDREYLWHWSVEDGGFAEWYGDEPGPVAEQTVDQQRRNEIAMAKRQAHKRGLDWLEVLMERARKQMELQCA